MSTLTEITSQINDEMTLDAEGKGSISMRGVARLAGVRVQTLSKHFLIPSKENVAFVPSALSKKLTARGFQHSAGVSISDLALAVVLEYYAFDAGKRCTEQARQCVGVFAAMGIRTWVQSLKGYSQSLPQPQSTPLPQPQQSLPQTKPLAHKSILDAITEQVTRIQADTLDMEMDTLDLNLIYLEKLEKLTQHLTEVAKQHRVRLTSFLQCHKLEHVRTFDNLHFINLPFVEFVFPDENLTDLLAFAPEFVELSINVDFCTKHLSKSVDLGIEHFQQDRYYLTRKLAQVARFHYAAAIGGGHPNVSVLVESNRGAAWGLE